MKKRYTVFFKQIPLNFTLINRPILSIKSGEKVISEVCGVLIVSSDIPAKLHNSILLSVIYSKCRLVDYMQTKQFCNPFEEKYFASLRIL